MNGKMKSSLRVCLALVPFASFAASSILAQGPSAVGVPDDWTHRHQIFSNPGSLGDAMNRGTLGNWNRIVNEPRFQVQRWKRLAPLTGGHDLQGRRQPKTDAIKTDWSMNLGSGAKVGAGQFPAKYSFSTTTSSCSDWVAYNTGVAGVAATQANIVAYSNLYDTTCTAPVPSVDWAYFSGTGSALTSMVVSPDGSKVAYVENTGSGAFLRILAWHAGQGSPAAPATPNHVFVNTVAGAGGNTAWNTTNCPTPGSCLISVAFQNLDQDTNSSPFYLYDGSDTLYVGDNSGKLHKFTGVFSGTPGEVTTTWPLTVSANVLTSPVYDSTSGNIFVADSGGFLYSYKAATGLRVMVSSKLSSATGVGIADAPLVDSTTEQVYVFVGDDANTSASLDCASAAGCSGVFQFAATDATTGTGACFATSATAWSGNNCGVESLFGAAVPTSQTIYDGAFDHIYEVGTGTTGNIWTCSEHNPSGAAGPRLSYVPIQSSGSIVTTGIYSLATIAISALTSNTTTTACSPVTEMWGAAGGNKDYIFLTVAGNGNQTGTTCSGAGTAGACLYNFAVATGGTATTAGTLTVPASATAGIAAASGSSGIVVDNSSALAGESQIYYTPLGNQACGGNGVTGTGTGGCAVQTSQTLP